MPDRLTAVLYTLRAQGLTGVEADESRGSIVLTGMVANWPQYIAAGYAAAGRGFRAVVNDITVPGVVPRPMYLPPAKSLDLEGEEFDVLVIGGGVVGCAIARELSRWDIRVAVLEKEEDVARQGSSRNNGIIHAGMDIKTGTKKLSYNIRGNRMYNDVARELDFPLRRSGLLALLEKTYLQLAYPWVLYQTRVKGITGARLISAREVVRLAPHATPKQRGALHLSSTAVVSPYKVTIAYAENAVQNGVRIFLHTAALGMEMSAGRITAVQTNRGRLLTKAVVNAAGVWADVVAGMAGDRFFSIHGRKGTLAVLDKKCGEWQNINLGMPKVGKRSYTKGGGLNTTVDGNLIAGPTVSEVPHREDWSTSAEELDFIAATHLSLNTAVNKRDVISYFAGVRACTFDEDFIIEASTAVPNLIHAAGIQSPGLTAAPAIAVDVAQLAVHALRDAIEVKVRASFEPRRLKYPELARLTLEQRAQLIADRPDYGRIVCRCETVSAGEIVDAVTGGVPALSQDAVKRRTRAGMGRCQGGFCTPAVVQTLIDAHGGSLTAVTKTRTGSYLIRRATKASPNQEAGGER